MMVTGDVGIDIVFNELKTNGTSVKIFGNFHISFLICLGFFFFFLLLLIFLWGAGVVSMCLVAALVY